MPHPVTVTSNYLEFYHIVHYSLPKQEKRVVSSVDFMVRLSYNT